MITSVDHLAIPGLTDEEWEAFQAGLGRFTGRGLVTPMCSRLGCAGAAPRSPCSMRIVSLDSRWRSHPRQSLRLATAP